MGWVTLIEFVKHTFDAHSSGRMFSSKNVFVNQTKGNKTRIEIEKENE